VNTKSVIPKFSLEESRLPRIDAWAPVSLEYASAYRNIRARLQIETSAAPGFLKEEFRNDTRRELRATACEDRNNRSHPHCPPEPSLLSHDFLRALGLTCSYFNNNGLARAVSFNLDRNLFTYMSLSQKAEYVLVAGDVIVTESDDRVAWSQARPLRWRIVVHDDDFGAFRTVVELDSELSMRPDSRVRQLQTE
jgi:hypothetical protein